MKHVVCVPVLCAAMFALAGCGDTTGDRAVTGAGMGAAGGAIIGAITPMSVGTGALIGAAVGGAAGALTDKSQINLGDSPWSKKSSSSAAAAPASSSVRAVQSDLAALGYNPGPIDGKTGAQTRAAVREYQQANGLPADGAITPQLVQRLAQQRQMAGR
jgi:peptidoglycan hydrolase-like protein with peptidoglycan-binding domain